MSFLLCSSFSFFSINKMPSLAWAVALHLLLALSSCGNDSQDSTTRSNTHHFNLEISR
jgi:hypothetical protein